MKTVPLAGTLRSVTFFEDDTIETVRQTVALAVASHPDRLFLEVNATLPRDYYSSNPSHWTDLFLRLSLDGETISAAMMSVYVTQIRPDAGVAPQDITRSQWEEHDAVLTPIYAPKEDFDEWRILGVEAVKSFCLPIPPSADIPALRAAYRPTLQPQSLFETIHPYPTTEIRATVIPDAAPATVRFNYVPQFRPDVTPSTIEPLRDSIESQHTQLRRLLDLTVPAHETLSIVRVKWYIPLISTRIPAPRARFEQIFYGMTVNDTTPYIGFFTARTESTRHKFFVVDPKTKKPALDIPMWKAWTAHTQPQRRRPTLLLYRGRSRSSFDRIAVTDKEITIDVRREKGSTESLDHMGSEIMTWMMSLDALTPFLEMSDLDRSRWDLADLSVLATYAKEVREFDMRRLPCMQSVFSAQGDTFRLLRADHTSDNVSPRELQALAILAQDDVERAPATLVEDMGLSASEAEALFAQIAERLEDLNLEKSLKSYPVIKFSSTEVILKFATNLDRTLQYVNLLRHVLTSDSEAVDAVCPKRMESVQARVVVPQQELAIVDDFGLEADDDFNALLDFGDDEDAAPPDVDTPAPAVPDPLPRSRVVKVATRPVSTHNYFNNRLQSFDPDTFDKSIFSGKCDKPRQPVVLTPADTARLGTDYDFSTRPPLERLSVEDPAGTILCPPYWCMRDEAPLLVEQLVSKAGGDMQCPLCGGKVRTSDSQSVTEYPVIKRDTAAKFPDFIKQASTINKRKIPCCFQTPRSVAEVLASPADSNYILDASIHSVPALRVSFLPSDLAEQLGLTTSYARTVKKGQLQPGERDMFRIGLGRPSKTLPVILDDKTPIRRPRESRENLLRCSFFRRWKGRGQGESELDKIVSSIDQAYQAGDLPFLDELEYVTSFLLCEVIRVDVETSEVICGFWSDAVGASSRTIVVMGTTIVSEVIRIRTKPYRRMFMADLRKPAFARTRTLLKERHTRACSTNVPLLADAITELRAKGKAEYQVILDPFQRIQAAMVPGEIILPVHPAVGLPDRGVVVRTGYSDIRDDELPTVEMARAFLAEVQNPMFAIQGPRTNQAGMVVELELASGFRVPVQPEAGAGEARDIVATVRSQTEESLVTAPPNPLDATLASTITYSSEIVEFLLFSISKDIQNDDYAGLRVAIRDRTAALGAELRAWFRREAYSSAIDSPIAFVNKVRTPCGQFRDKASCNGSTLCGWKTVKGTGVCKIRVKSTVDTGDVLQRIATTLRGNDKQRALVLDGRMSPFFSTMLYLELPHELITTSI
jgi:Asp-tRNA(Asn)/Glu-tRNA(Gln) amidotransferase C subunit